MPLTMNGNVKGPNVKYSPILPSSFSMMKFIKPAKDRIKKAVNKNAYTYLFHCRNFKNTNAMKPCMMVITGPAAEVIILCKSVGC